MTARSPRKMKTGESFFNREAAKAAKSLCVLCVFAVYFWLFTKMCGRVPAMEFCFFQCRQKKASYTRSTKSLIILIWTSNRWRGSFTKYTTVG